MIDSAWCDFLLFSGNVEHERDYDHGVFFLLVCFWFSARCYFPPSDLVIEVVNVIIE